MINEIGNIMFVAAALGALTFTVLYSVTAPWWRNITGRFIWIVFTAVTGIFILGAYKLVFGLNDNLLIIRAVAYVILTLAIWGAVVALIRVQVLRNRATRHRLKKSEDLHSSDV